MRMLHSVLGLASRRSLLPVWAAALVLTVLPAVAKPPVKKKPPGTRTAGSSSAESSAVSAAPASRQVADTLPTNDPGKPDQALSRDGERKAEALAFYAQGLLAEDNADADGALSAYKQAFEKDPSNADLAVKLAFMLASRDDTPAGIEVLKDAIKYAPKEPMPLIYLAQLYAKYLKKVDVAQKYADQALALDRNFYPAYLAVYELSSALGQDAKAKQTLDKAAGATSQDPQFWLNVGSLHAQVYLKDDGVAASSEALTRMNSLYRKAAGLAQRDALVQAKVGNYFVDSRQVAESIPYYQAALRLREAGEDDPVLANAGDKLAAALAEAGRRDEAMAVLEKVTKENPMRFESFEVLGKLYEDKGDLDGALRNYKQSMLLDASEPENHLRILRMELRMKRFDDAVETARATRALFPGNLVATVMLAESLTAAKKHTEALAVFAEALHAVEAGGEGQLTSDFYLSYGAAAEQAGKVDEAAELMRKSIDLDPNGAAQAYNYLGYMWVERGVHLEEGGEMIKKALEMEPDNGAFLDSLGWFYFKKAEFDRALQYLLKAEAVTKPDDSVIMEHLGDTYQHLGKVPEAMQYWQRSVALDGENKQAVADKLDAAKQKVAKKLPDKK